MLASAGGVLALLLLVVVLNIDRTQNQPKPPPANLTATELINPGELTADDLKAAGGNIRKMTAINSPQGGWIEQVDERGRIKQQYRYDRSEALPAGLLRVDKPQVKLFLSGNRMTYLTGDSALIKAPEQSLDEGRITGNVVIRMFEIPDSGLVDVETDTPIVLITTHEAQFNNFQGEIYCEGRVILQTETAYESGKTLRLRINDKLNRPEWLRIEEIEIVKLAALPDPAIRPTGDAPATAHAQTRPAKPKKLKDPSASQPTKPVRTDDERAARRAERQKVASTSQPAHAEQFYRLKFERDVRIRQGDDQTGWTANGDELSVVFSMKSSGLGDGLALQTSAESQTQLVASHPLTLNETLAALTLASMPNQSQPDAVAPLDLYISTPEEVIITCSGGLTMTPEPVNQAPTSAEESILQLTGSPATFFSHADKARLSCQTLQYKALAEVLDLTGSTAHPLQVSTPDFRAEGLHFTFDRRKNEGGFVDQGWLESVKGSDALMGPARDESATQPESKNPPLRIDWTKRVDLRFHPQHPAANAASTKTEDKLRIEFANFLGDVIVTSDDFVLESASLAVNFTDLPGKQQAVNHILATDGVRVRSTRDKGTLGCDTLIIELALSRDDRTIPLMMTATGSVEAVDESQILWTDLLIAKFAEIDPDQPEHAATDPARRGPRMGRSGVEVVSVQADRNVQIRMNDGTRAFADQMQGDPVNGSVILTADTELLIASQTMVIDQGRRLELNRDQQTARWPGSGRARVFRDNVMADSMTRMDRPVIDESTNPMQVRAVWTDSMTFDNTVNDGGGALEIIGHVDAVSQPSPLEYNTMTGQSLRLEFAKVAEGATAVDMNRSSPPSNSPVSMMQGKRQLNKMTAKGDAKLESRSWLKNDHSDVPRVFYVAGDSVWYNNLTLEAGVPSPGQLLVRDERTLQGAPDAAAPRDGQEPLASFNASGTTAFKWNGELRMTRIADNRYRIDMSKDVEILHKDLNNLGTTVTGQSLQATVERSATNREKNAAVDLGGSMELIGLYGDGGVYIRTPQRDVSTDTFDYDLLTQTAQLSATDNRTVTVITRGNPNVLKAHLMTWNMAKDVITIIRGSGTANR